METGELPDVIISDLNMRGRNGLEPIRRLKTSERLQNIPVYVLTSSSHPGDRAQCLSAGAREYLVKPSQVSQYPDIATRILRFFIAIACGFERPPRQRKMAELTAI